MIAVQKNIGWNYVQLDEITKMQKSWIWEGKEYKVDVFFGRLCNGWGTPVIVSNVYEDGANVEEVIDDNCDIWTNVFTRTTKEEGNAYYKYLVKHGFKK